MNIILHFAGNKTLELTDHTPINIQRTKDLLDVNITNTCEDLFLNGVYDKIIALQGADETFDLSIRTEMGNTAEYAGLTANYYNSGDCEILHITTNRKL